MTPVWFLDVDGVVNAAGQNLAPHLVRTEATTDGTTWPIHYSPDVVAFINLVHRNGLAEVRWLTTWGQDARTSLAPAVGLDEFTAYDMYDGLGWWKAEIVAGVLNEEGRPIIWTDDDLATEDVVALAETGIRSLTVSPETEIGLTSDTLRDIMSFITEENRS